MRKRKCKFCRDEFLGRPDKRFCDNYCRSAFHNDRLRNELRQMRTINNMLRKNRSILKEFFKKGLRKVSYQKLLEMGFNFDHFTQIREDEGKKYCYCYEMAYVEEEAGLYGIQTCQ